MANDDPILTTMRFIPKHETVQRYDAIIPDTLANQAMKESDAYKTYHDFATGKIIPKPKYVRRLTREKTDQALTSSPGKRLKATAKVAKSGKKMLPAQGLEILSEIALSEAEQMKIVTKRSKTQFHSSHAGGSGANEGTGVSLGVPDVPTYGSKVEQISLKSSDEDDDDEVSLSKDDDDNADNEDDDGHDDDNELTKSDNNGDDFVHPKFSTHDEEERQDEEDKDKEGSDLRVQTPSHFESTDDETYDEVTQGDNVEGEELDEEEDVNELYRDVNVNLERRDTKMTNALQTNQSSSVSSGFIYNMLNPNLDTGIDSILNLNTESTSLVDVPITTNVEMPPSSVTTLPPPPIPLVQPQQQTPIPTPAIVLSTSLQNLPTFGSLFKFEDRVKDLEDDFSQFKQTNLFAEAVSSIPGIVDKYLANQINEAVKAAVQLQSDRLRSEAQADNEDFINKIDENIKKIIKEQVKIQVKEQVTKILPIIEKSVNEQLEAEVLIRSSNKAKTSHVVAANLSELELKKILLDKMENNKSIDRLVQQKNLYKALVNAYEYDKDILATYGDSVTLKRRRDDKDEDEEPSARSNRGSKRRRARKEPESTSALKEKTSKSFGKSKEGSKSHQKSTGKSAQAEEPIHADKDLEEPAHQEFDTRFTEDQPVDETTQHLDWFQKPTEPPTLDRNWNKTLPAKHGPIQPWISTLAWNKDPRESFNELMDTPLEFSAFVLNWLKVDTLTPELLAGLTFELMKGSYKSLVELEYFLEEVCKATTDQLDNNNPEGQQYPHDLRKPLPLIPNSRGRRVIPFDHFINNDLVYLSGGVSSRTYATSVTKIKAADYGHIKWIEDFIPNLMWSQVPIVYDKHALWGISHWGRKRQQFYGFVVNRESAHDKHCHQKACGRSSIGDQKLPKEAQPHKSRYVQIRSQNARHHKHILPIPEEQKVNEEPGKIHWWETVRRRPSAAGKDHMIYHMMHRYSNPMIQPEPEGSTQGYLLVSVEVLSETVTHWFALIVLSALRSSDNENMLSTMNLIHMSILMDSKVTPTKHGRMKKPYSSPCFIANCFISGIYKDGHGVKEFQRSFRHSNTERLSRSDEVLKLKIFKKDAALKLFKSTNQERYEHVLKITFSHSRQAIEQAQDLKSMITTSIHKLINEVKDYELKTTVEKDIVELFFVRTEYQLDDLFTKALPKDRFKYLVRRLGMRCLTPKELEVLANESA
ncbi:hypothetical protein Tco_0116302 [Tanacetum coccineum]